ncbi:MAG: type I 3-dehydroquinate dehydratase [Verrucomicrobiales bacterium]|nr:type I 3-dehydroquinate dehydratase [Verrucomicrobiales bacterium]
MVPTHPAIVGAVADRDTLTALPDLEGIIQLCDYVEFRVDALLENEELLVRRLADCSRPILITVRDPVEGGLFNLTPQDRQQRMLDFLPHTTLLDIEIRNLEAFGQVVSKAKSQGVSIVASYHDFLTTPPRESLDEAVQRGLAGGADIIKLAVTTENALDLHTLLQLQEDTRSQAPLTVMGMGFLGMSSRVVAAQAGALLTYTYLKEANAPGQWSAHLMRHLFDELGIERPSLTS